MRIAHLSDPHFGRIVSVREQEALIESIRTHKCDAVLVTGDLTQRARVSEFKAARDFLCALPEPRLVIPGNHDVHAWWHRPDLRIFNPFRRYKKWISTELEQEITTSNLAVLGLNTAHGLTFQGGRCTDSQVERIHNFFLCQPSDKFKILAVHHPLVALEGIAARDVARNGKQVLVAAAESGVHVVCAGHWHLSYAEMCEVIGVRLLLVMAGTATSDRWRFPQFGMNSWCLVERSPELSVQVYTYDLSTHSFAHSEIFQAEKFPYSTTTKI